MTLERMQEIADLVGQLETSLLKKLSLSSSAWDIVADLRSCVDDALLAAQEDERARINAEFLQSKNHDLPQPPGPVHF